MTQARWTVMIVMMLVAPAVTASLVLGMRIAATTGPAGAYRSTSGGESVSALNVLKFQRGMPLYERSDQPPYYPTTLYNAGFYVAYGLATAGMGPNIAAVVLGCRLFTLLLAGVGLIAALGYGTAVARRSVDGDGGDRRLATAAAMALAILGVGLGGVPGWWLLTIRPDIGGAALAACGLACALGIGPRNNGRAGLAAGACLALAWTFKQSSVLILAGVVVAAVAQRRWRFLAALVAPPIATATAMAMLLGPEYRYNTAFATSLAGFDVHNLVAQATHLAIKGILPLTLSVLGLILLWADRRLRPDERLTLTLCWATTLFGGLAASLRNGSSMNYFFEFNGVAAFLAVIGSRRLIEIGTQASANIPTIRRWRRASLVALAGASVATTAQETGRLALPNQLDVGRARYAAVRTDEMARLKAVFRDVDGPVFCQPGLSGLSLDLPLPVYHLDDEAYFHAPAAQRGLLNGSGPRGWFAEHRFRLVVLEPGSEGPEELVRSAGYVPQAGWSSVVVYAPPNQPALAVAR